MADASPEAESGLDAPLVLIHGDFGDGFDTWGETARLLGASCRTIIVDRPGFGAPIGSDERFTIDGDARYVEQIVDEMRLASWHLVGHSYGALVALELAIRRPAQIRSLHLIEPPLLALLGEDDAARRMDRDIRVIQTRHGELGDEATTAAFFPMIGAERVVERLRGTPDWDRLCGYATRFARSEPAGDYLAANLDRLSSDIPVGLYTGGRSHPVLRAIVAVLTERFPGAPCTDIPTAGHAVQMAGAPFIEPLLALAQQADREWRQRALVAPGDSAGEERALG